MATGSTSQNRNVLATLKTQRILRDKLFMTFVVLSFLLALAVIVLLIIQVRPKDFLVPLGYSTTGSFDILGPWYQTYTYGVFALLVTAGNFAFAVMSYEKSRLTSFLLVIGTVVINIFTLVITNAVLAHVSL